MQRKQFVVANLCTHLSLVRLTILLLTSLAAANSLAELAVAPVASAAKPDFNGIWQALGSAHWNIEPHSAYPGSRANSNAFAAARAGVGIVNQGKIPYQAWARQKQQQNFAGRHELDPAAKCFMPGVPRANYMPYPLQIVQTPEHLFIAYEFAQASRTIYLQQPDFEAPVASWMGHSLGRWEEDTLLVDVTAQVADSWFDRAGNFHSDDLHVEERYTLQSPDHLRYEATITDPNVFTDSWRISTVLYRQVEDHAQLLAFKCVEFVEPLMYGHLSKAKADEPPTAHNQGSQP